MESRGVQQESGAFAERRDRGGIFSTSAGTREAAHVGWTFHSGRDTDRGLGRSEEFPAQGRQGKPPGAGGEVDFHGEKRKNQTHGSTTDPDARLFRKSKGSEAKLGYLGHVLMGNRNGLLVQTFLSEANGRAERDAAMLMVETIPGGKRVTLAGDKNYDTQELVRELRDHLEPKRLTHYYITRLERL
jgi:hypothetical protein